MSGSRPAGPSPTPPLTARSRMTAPDWAMAAASLSAHRARSPLSASWVRATIAISSRTPSTKFARRSRLRSRRHELNTSRSAALAAAGRTIEHCAACRAEPCLLPRHAACDPGLVGNFVRAKAVGVVLARSLLHGPKIGLAKCGGGHEEKGRGQGERQFHSHGDEPLQDAQTRAAAAP